MIRLLCGVLFVGAIPAALNAQATDYFQQDVAYRIEAVLDEDAEVLRGRARLTYTNRAPARLDTLFLHQHLNAFRPNSAWARRDLEFGERRFQDLGPREHAFERLLSVSVDGRPVRPVYPHAPDSTVFALPLATPLEPDMTAVVEFDWLARPSTLPRRQGRRGRHYDFAQWYPRIAVYDRGGWQEHVLLPQGEFYGEFARYDVTLDVAGDQVIGATGVPVHGDPGWQDASAGTGPVLLARDAYGEPPPVPALGLLDDGIAPGRKRVRWLARDVHHFAWSTAPDYIYEGGRYAGGTDGEVLLHVLYQPGDTAWDEGVALERMRSALAFLEDVLGPYPYPQVTNLHRIEGGGTEFPMLVMNGSASQGLIMHELAHIYVHGILANNEWAEAWLDEGFASFLTSWFYEERGEGSWAEALDELAARERAGATQPVGLEAADFVDYATYGAMSYSKGSTFLYMLRELLGEDVFRQGLRRYYETHRFQHVTEADLRAALEAVSGRELDWFFRQWLHTTDRLDYGIGDVATQRTGAGWETTVEVIRLGEAWMPVTLRVGTESLRLTGRERVQHVTVRTPTRPEAVTLDPASLILDFDPSNDRRELVAPDAS
ncbi:MAG: M1 family metallopeptidase [Longimicrobiales bacterium]